MRLRVPLFLLAAAWPAPAGVAAPAPLAVVAAENFYADVASQIGGPDANVSSILSNPDQDPHLFEATPSAARAIAAARVVVYNGLDYDPWIVKLIAANGGAGDRQVIVAADLLGKRPGDNPHIWYDPATMPRLAEALAAAFSHADPGHQIDYRRRLAAFAQSMKPVADKVATLRRRAAGIVVTATEPVFGDMFAALGMVVRNGRFQLAVMNDTERSAADVGAFETDLQNRKVALLVYNKQAADALARRMVNIAQAAHVPVIGVTETEPPDTTYQAWMLDVLAAVDRALPH